MWSGSVKIYPNIKFNHSSQEFKEHLCFLHPDDIFLSVWIFLVGLYNVPLFVSLLTIGKIEFLWLLMPLIVALHLWGIRLSIKNPYSTQLESVLFLGVYGVVGALTFFIMIQGISFYILNISALIYYIVINMLLVISTYFFIKYQIDKFSRDPTEEQNRANPYKNSAFLSTVPILGSVIGRKLTDIDPLEFLFILGLIFFIYYFHVFAAAKFMHRYFFIKENFAYMSYEKPSKKERKELIKKGVEYK